MLTDLPVDVIDVIMTFVPLYESKMVVRTLNGYMRDYVDQSERRVCDRRHDFLHNIMLCSCGIGWGMSSARYNTLNVQSCILARAQSIHTAWTLCAQVAVPWDHAVIRRYVQFNCSNLNISYFNPSHIIAMMIIGGYTEGLSLVRYFGMFGIYKQVPTTASDWAKLF